MGGGISGIGGGVGGEIIFCGIPVPWLGVGVDYQAQGGGMVICWGGGGGAIKFEGVVGGKGCI